MAQVLLIGGKMDGEIIERTFVQDGSFHVWHDSIKVRRITGNSDALIEQQTMPMTIYHMDVVVIDGKRFAYATCKSIQGFEVIERIKDSELKPIN